MGMNRVRPKAGDQTLTQVPSMTANAAAPTMAKAQRGDRMKAFSGVGASKMKSAGRYLPAM